MAQVTVTLPEELISALGAWSRRTGEPISRLVSQAVEQEIRRQAGLAAVEEWEAEHGAFTPEELAAARAEMAAADAELLAGLGKEGAR